MKLVVLRGICLIRCEASVNGGILLPAVHYDYDAMTRFRKKMTYGHLCVGEVEGPVVLHLYHGFVSNYQYIDWSALGYLVELPEPQESVPEVEP